MSTWVKINYEPSGSERVLFHNRPIVGECFNRGEGDHRITEIIHTPDEVGYEMVLVAEKVRPKPGWGCPPPRGEIVEGSERLT